MMQPGAATRASAALVRSIPFGVRSEEEPVSASVEGEELNLVRTARYTPYNFFFKNLYEQFQKQANVYFLAVSILMLLGEHTCLFVGTIKAWSTAALLGLMMCVTGFMAIVDDIQRHQADRVMNYERQARRVDTSGVRSIPWAEVRVGDVLEVHRDEEFPADMVALSTSDEQGFCYVSTTNLDGETNLKLKEAAWQTRGLDSLCAGTVQVPAPSADLYSFAATLDAPNPSGAGMRPLALTHLLMKGARLRLTNKCRGVVIYVGADTRMQMNTQAAPSKMPNIEKVINASMWVAVALQAALALATAGAYIQTRTYFQALPYLYPTGFKSNLCLPDPLAYFLTFFVLYSNLVPVSLYATMELCNAAFAIFIHSDSALRVPDGLGQECAPRVRATNLCHELGQINHIFSDKTGTLTRNVMDLHSLWPADCAQPLGRGAEEMQQSRVAAVDSAERMLFLVALLCHDARRDEEGSIVGTSAEEVALLQGAETYGWKFLGRQGAKVCIEVPWLGGRCQEEYDILAVNEFESTRKCMSVVVQNAKTKTKTLLIKGADVALLGQDRSGHARAAAAQQARADECARRGQRAMLAGWSSFQGASCEAWLQRRAAAACGCSSSRAAELDALAREAEHPSSLHIAGVLCIEDKLQERVPETIAALRQAGIRIWVLTGDCSGTAEAVARCAELFDEATRVVRFTDGCSWANARAALAAEKGFQIGMLVGGRELETLADEDHASFLEAALRVDALVACRVTPSQKAQLVRMVRENVSQGKMRFLGASPRPVTLAVGDGANDVGMLQEAQLGVGIVGREGLQAANSADFAVGQFRCLQRLLLVHGHWNYSRSAQVVLFSFWRNAVQEFMMCYYTFASGFSGTPLFEDHIRITFNFLCTIPIVGLGLFDRCAEARTLLATPAAFKVSRDGTLLNPARMLFGLGHATMHSLILTFVAASALEPLHAANIGDYWSFCVITYTLLVVGCNYRVAFLSRTWNAPLVLLHLLSLLCYALFLCVYNGFASPGTLTGDKAWTYTVPSRVFRTRIAFFCVGASILGQLIFDGTVEFLWRASKDSRLPLDLLSSGPSRDADDDKDEDGEEEEEEDEILEEEEEELSLFGKAREQRLPSCQRTRLHLQILMGAAGTIAFFMGLTAGAGSLHTTVLAQQYSAAPENATLRLRFHVPTALRDKALVSYVIEPFYQNYNLMRANLRLLQGSEFNDSICFPGHNLSLEGVGWSTDIEMLRSARDASAAHLAAWVRADATPRLEKRYGWLDAGLPAGNLEAYVVSNYDAAALGAVKKLQISSSSAVFGWSLSAYLLIWSIAAFIVVYSARDSFCPKDDGHEPLIGSSSAP